MASKDELFPDDDLWLLDDEADDPVEFLPEVRQTVGRAHPDELGLRNLLEAPPRHLHLPAA